MTSQNATILTIVGVILLTLVGFGGYYLGNSNKQQQKSDQPIAIPTVIPTVLLTSFPTLPEQHGCSKEAKVCADGTLVGRSGPNCEYAPCPEDNLGPPILITSAVTKSCKMVGCSSELCVDASNSDKMLSTCVYKNEYGCLKHSRCELQSDGKCGWTQTEEYKQCLLNVKSNNVESPQ